MADLPLDHEYVPPEASDDGPAPAVVVMHGRGADERDLLPITEPFPDQFAVVSLRAPDRLMGGYTWYELDMSAGRLAESQPDPDGFRRSLDRAHESIEIAVDAYDIDPDHVGLLGFSQGAIMACSLLLEAPKRVAWIAALHGYLAAAHAELEPPGLEGKPVFVTAGTEDQLIPASRAETAADRLAELGCAVTFDSYPTGHGVGPAELADLVEFVDARTA